MKEAIMRELMLKISRILNSLKRSLDIHRGQTSPAVFRLIVSITKYSLLIGSPRAYLLRNCSSITWVSNYSCPI